MAEEIIKIELIITIPTITHKESVHNKDIFDLIEREGT
jgi:hypothetical protein